MIRNSTMCWNDLVRSGVLQMLKIHIADEQNRINGFQQMEDIMLLPKQ